MNKPEWWQDWRGECVAIIGAGPSAKTAGVEKLRDRIHVIAVNESYQLCPWAEILYACEAMWWKQRERETAKFAGIKLSFEPPLLLAFPQKIHRVTIRKVKNPNAPDPYVHEFLFDKPGEVGSGQNSGFQAINIAAQLGATGIALVGFDMHLMRGVHWHGLHPSPLRNPDYDRFTHWREHLTKGAPTLAARGIDVVNCSAESALTVFPKLTIDQALERWGL